MGATDAAENPADGDDAGSSRLEELGRFIREQRRITELSMRRLAELANVSNPYLSQIERGLRKPSADILQQIASALSISAESLYVRAGILDADRDAIGVLEAIRSDPHLSGEQKQALVQIYTSFRAESGAPVGGEEGGG